MDDPLLPDESEVDERIIATALRYTAIALGGLVVLVLAIVLLLSRGAETQEVRAKDLSAPEVSVPVAAERPQLPFTDVTAEWGIDFVHDNGATGERLLPETMGGGVAVLDYDVDGDPDLLFVSGTNWPWDRQGQTRSSLELYRNRGDGHFERVTTAAGMVHRLYGMGAAVGDADNDGDPDLFITAVGPDLLLRNDGGRFVDVTKRAGAAGERDAWSTAAGFFDADNDGDLDLLVAHYVQWSRETDFEVAFTLNGRDRAYGPPNSFAGTQLSLLRNDGDWRFTDISAEAGIHVDNPATGEPMAKALGISFADLDADGWIDVLVANDTVRNFLFRNRGDGSFAEVGAQAGIAFDTAGNTTGGMGIDIGSLRDDGQLAVAIGNFANEMTSLYVQQGEPWLFADEATIEGVGAPSRLRLSFGVLFLDADLDGRLDLLQINGHLEETIHEVQASQHYRQVAQLFWNAGPEAPSCLVAMPEEETGDLASPIVGRGVVSADLDADGDLDLVLVQNGGRPLVLRNDQATGHHWLQVRLEGTTANRDAIGAWIEVTAAGRMQRRQVMPTRGYLSQLPRDLTIGLGTATTIDRLRITWPDGSIQDVEPPKVDTRVTIRQPEA